MNLAPEGTTANDATTDAAAPPLTAIIEEAERRFGAGQADDARQYLEDARRRFYESGDASSEGAVLRSLANLEFSLIHPREAARYLELACARYSANHSSTTADVYLSLGDVRTKMGENKTAREAYLAGAKIYRNVDDALGQAHAEFKLGTLHALTNYDMSFRHYSFAATLYEKAESRRPAEEGLRITNPHLPEDFEDCRHIDAAIMARVARREAERLQLKVNAAAAEKPVAAPPSSAMADILYGGLGFILVPAVFIGAVFVVTKVPAFPLSTDQTLLLPLSLLAGGLSMLMARMNGVKSKAIQWGGAVAVCASVQIASLALTRHYAIPPSGDDDSVRVVIADELADLGVASNAPAEVAKKRIELRIVLTKARERGDRPAQASVLRAQAELEQNAGARAQATTLYGEALKIYRDLDDKPKQLELLVPLGEAQRALKQYAQARESFSQAAELYQQRQDSLNQAKMLLQVGDLERDLQRPKQARAAYARAIELNHDKDPGAEANALLHLGTLEAETHATDSARQTFRDALALSQQRSDITGQAAALLHLGTLEVDVKKYDDAAVLYGQALDLYRTEQNVKGQVHALQLWGDLERTRKQFAGAREYYAQALALSEEKDASAQAAEILIALGDVTATMNEREQARDTYMRALGRHEQTGNVEGQILTLRRLSQLAAKDNLTLAQQYAKRAAALQEGSETGPATN
jgi:tetratricopeptide (TPR) repeat protein